MQQMMGRIGVALAIICVATTLATSPAQAATGRVSVDAGCQHQVGWFSYSKALDQRNVYSWRCVIPAEYQINHVTQLVGVDMNDACHQTFPWASGWARFTDAHDAGSWYCTY